ncbi:MAG: hypothetical protein KGP14_03320 [Betaproteobacteria bacterium]|nr:hypothetical protein [Betaproteobacteria bacterium]
MPTHQPIRLKRVEVEYNRYFDVVPPGITLEEVMTTDYWVNVRRQIRLHDVLEVVAADGAFDAEFRVTMIDHIRGLMTFRLLRETKGPKIAASLPSQADRYAVKHRGHGNWAVVEIATGSVVSEGMSREAAEATRIEAEAGRKAA